MVHLLFLASGFASLIYQVIWTRQLALLFGSTVHSASTTVAAFLCGLGLGARLAAPLLRRGWHPGRLFACLELLVAAFSLGLTWALPHAAVPVAGIIEILQGHEALLGIARFGIVFVLLAFPCVAMGATLPVLSALCASEPKHFGKSLASLYAINTLGAALGAVVADFFLIRAVGVFHTAAIGSALDLGVGLLGLWVLGNQRIATPPLKVEAEAMPAVKTYQEPILLALTGFCGLALEILFIRILVFYNGSDVYAFSSVVATFLLGLVGGSALVGRLLSRAWPHLISGLLLGLTASVYLSLGATMAIPAMRSVVMPALHGLSFDVIRFITDAFVVFPSALCLGALFPALCDRLLQKSKSSEGKPESVVGVAYQWNTVGSLFGSLSAAFVILPWIGLQGSLQLVMLVAWIAACTEIYRRPSPVTVSLAGLLLLGNLTLPSEVLARRLFGANFDRIIYWGEDAYGTIALIPQYNAQECRDNVNLIVDGYNMMGNDIDAKRYAATLAALPILARGDAKSVLVIAFGLCNTLSTAVDMTSTRHVDCVELSPTVVKASGHLDYVQETLRSPKLQIIYTDGRNFVATTQRRYDVITAEPPPPIHAGIVNLYSREYFQNCRRCLNPGGIVAHWLPINQMAAFEARTILRACLEVFPNTYVWQGAGENLVILASVDPIAFDWNSLRQSFADNRPTLLEHGIDSAEILLASCLRTPAQVRDYVASTPALTDDRPYIQNYSGPWNPDMAFFYISPAGMPAQGLDAAAPNYLAGREFVSSVNLLRLGGQEDPLKARLKRWALARQLHLLQPESRYVDMITRSAPDIQRILQEQMAGDPESSYDLFGAYLARGEWEKAQQMLSSEASQKWPPELREAAGKLLTELKAKS